MLQSSNEISKANRRSWGPIAALTMARAVGAIVCSASAPAQAATEGWQPIWANVTIPQGQTTHFFELNCPAQFPVVVSGSYAFNSIGQSSGVAVGFSGPRIDENPPKFNGWGFNFNFVNGAPSGMTVSMDIFCAKRG
jgi:hypothetical protein